MRLPRERGPLSRWVLRTLVEERDHVSRLALGTSPVTEDADAQLALWMIYELAYRGFDVVPDDAEWDPALIGLRRDIEQRFEAELRVATAARLREVDPDAGVGSALFTMVAAEDGPSAAAFLQREATRGQMVDFLRERSVQQLKESDPQSFVLPRLQGRAKVALAELQYDEYGGGDPTRLHQQLYAETMAAVGLDPTYGAYVDDVSALSLASANAMSMFGVNRRLRGAAMGHLAAFEASSSVPSRKVARGLDRLHLPSAASAYFLEHVEADAVHEHVAADDICGAMVTAEPELRDDVFFGAAACLHLDALSGQELLQRWTVRQMAS